MDEGHLTLFSMYFSFTLHPSLCSTFIKNRISTMTLGHSMLDAS